MTNNKTLLVTFFTLLAVGRMLLTNVNSAEWGDSYRILRASNFVREFSYPDDEKRPPLFSALLAIRPANIDPVLWGRLFMLVTSFSALFVFYKLCRYYLATENKRLLAIVLFFLNPVYLYWSVRIYADVFFSLLVLVCFYIFELWRETRENERKLSTLLVVAMGFICGLSILTRFEGYLLTLSILIGLGVMHGLEGKTIGVIPKKLLKNISVFIFMVGLTTLPWLLYRNPITSSYFEEPAGRKYDLEMILTYLISYLFVLGITPTFALIVHTFVKKSRTVFTDALKNYPHMLSFILLESLLILAWPAAVPRLFVPIIPFLIVGLIKSLDYFDTATKIGRRAVVLGAVIMLALYVLIQSKLRLQFLGSHTTVFIAVWALGLLSIVGLFLKSKKLYLLASICSMTVLSASTIYLHKDVYRSIKEIANFSLREVAGKVVHNDTASIVSWYLPESTYKNFDTKKYLTQGYLAENAIDYLIITNEFDPNMEIDLTKRPYLNLIKEANCERGGKMFFTWLVGVKK